MKNQLDDEQIAYRIALEIQPGWYVNLGAGIPNLICNYVDKLEDVTFHTESGCLGLGALAREGEQDPDLIDGGANPFTITPGAACFDSEWSFIMMRGGHLDLSVMGGLEVAENGDLANYEIPGKKLPGMGGGVDLAVGAKRVFIAMDHTTGNGLPRLLKRCKLPLTARNCVTTVFTNLAVVDVTRDGFLLRELAPGYTAEEVQALSEATLKVSPNLREVNLDGFERRSKVATVRPSAK